MNPGQTHACLVGSSSNPPTSLNNSAHRHRPPPPRSTAPEVPFGTPGLTSEAGLLSARHEAVPE
jgi:hypothetical protein